MASFPSAVIRDDAVAVSALRMAKPDKGQVRGGGCLTNVTPCMFFTEKRGAGLVEGGSVSKEVQKEKQKNMHFLFTFVVSVVAVTINGEK